MGAFEYRQAEEIRDTPEFKILHYQHRSLKATAE